MLLMMGSMYQNRKLNRGLHAVFVALFIASFILIRTQTPVGNVQFLRSMIPHHSGAILMCQKATITDPEIERLCGEIIRSQAAGIEQMEKILARY